MPSFFILSQWPSCAQRTHTHTVTRANNDLKIKTKLLEQNRFALSVSLSRLVRTILLSPRRKVPVWTRSRSAIDWFWSMICGAPQVQVRRRQSASWAGVRHDAWIRRPFDVFLFCCFFCEQNSWVGGMGCNLEKNQFNHNFEEKLTYYIFGISFHPILLNLIIIIYFSKTRLKKEKKNYCKVYFIMF